MGTNSITTIDETGVSEEFRIAIARWRLAMQSIVADLGGIGAAVVATTPDGVEHRGTVERVADCQGVVVRSGQKRYMIVTEWERYNSPDPGALLVSIRRDERQDHHDE